MAKKQKYYVVWRGKQPGIYTEWEACKEQVQGVQGAQYKSFGTREEAESALRMPYESVVASAAVGGGGKGGGHAAESVLSVGADGVVVLKPGVTNPPVLDALAVDAACSGNPGVMEYQGIYIATGTRMFHYRAEQGTNNIGEFLAIVHGLSYLKKHRLNQILYSDSANAISWVRQKQCKSKLPEDSRTTELWNYVHRAEQWLRDNDYTTEIRKWDTEQWGEIPADFGRK